MKKLVSWGFVFFLGGWMAGLYLGSDARAQHLPPESVQWTIEDACRVPSVIRPLYLLRWRTSVQPVSRSDARQQSPAARAGYEFAEEHLTPYADPATTSTWAGEKPYAVVQPTLRIDIAADRLFERWEEEGFALDLNWDQPPLQQSLTIDSFRPRLQPDSLAILYNQPPYRQQLVDFLFPLDTILPSRERTRRVRCVSEAFGIIDDARRSDRAHSPPHLSLLFNQSLTRAIASFGWGRRGGTWVAYRRSTNGWIEIRPIGRWAY